MTLEFQLLGFINKKRKHLAHSYGVLLLNKDFFFVDDESTTVCFPSAHSSITVMKALLSLWILTVLIPADPAHKGCTFSQISADFLHFTALCNVFSSYYSYLYFKQGLFCTNDLVSNVSCSWTSSWTGSDCWISGVKRLNKKPKHTLIT